MVILEKAEEQGVVTGGKHNAKGMRNKRWMYGAVMEGSEELGNRLTESRRRGNRLGMLCCH